MARGAKIKKVLGKRAVSYRTTVDVGTDPATGKRKQKVLTAKTKQELEKLVAQTLADVSRNVYFEPAKMTIGEYFDYWLKNHAKLNTEPTTYDNYFETIENHLKPAFGVIPLAKLTPAHVQQFIAKQAESGLAPSTVEGHYCVLSQSLNHAVKWEIVPRNVCKSVDRPKIPRKEAEILSKEQLDVIMLALKGTYHEKPSHVIEFTAMRVGEVLALKREDVYLDGEEPYVIVRHGLKDLRGGIIKDGCPKGKKPRRIDLEPETVAVFKARFKEIAEEKLAAGGLIENGGLYVDSGYIFPNPDGTARSPRTFSNRWGEEVFRKTGIVAHPHMLRHTAATLMLEAGVPLQQVSRMLGHASIKTTADIYGHVTPAGRREASRKLAEALRVRK